MVLTVLLGACSTGQTRPDPSLPSAGIAGLFEHFNDGKQPGAAVLVMQNNDVVFSHGFGYADLDRDVRIDERSMFRLASVSKQFTTMAIMRLAEAGKLSYDDTLIEHAPEFASWPGVTIRQLMNHTSGIPDYYEAGYYESHDSNGPMPQLADLPTIMHDYNRSDFAPGERFVYNNTAYELLALIVERVSGQPFSRFMDEQVFRPAGMKTATTFNSSRADIPNRVFAYSPAVGGFELDDFDPFNDMLGSGGVYASIEDFVAWIRALNRHALVSTATMNQAWDRNRLNDGSIYDYGFGWTVSSYRGYKVHMHTGSWVGFRTALMRLPDNGLSIVVLSNRSDGEPAHYAQRIADLFLPGRGNAFLPDESQPAVMEHHRRIPDDDHWWNVRGPEQGWLHRHTQQLFPTVPVYRGGQVRELENAIDPGIAAVEIETPEGRLPFDWYLESDHSTAMGVVILHEGKVVFEAYPRMREYEKVTYWSVAKVLTGAVVRLLEEQGEIELSKPIDHYVPRLADSVHAGTTVRNLLDMATGVDCAENYEDPESCYYRYSEAIGDNLRDDESPDNPYDFMATVNIERTNEQGAKFVYSGASNFLLMWLIDEVTGHTLADAVTTKFWRHIGAENDAAYIAYRYGIPLSHGGFIAKMRDLARFGLLYTPSWHLVSEKRIVSDAHLRAIMTANRPGLRPTAYAWGDRHEDGWLSHGGWGGQGLIVNPELDVVAVFTSYFKDDYSELPLQDAVMRVLSESFTDGSPNAQQ